MTGLSLRWRAWRASREMERDIRAEDHAARMAERAQRKAVRKTRRTVRQSAAQVSGVLAIARHAALGAITVIVAAATAASLAESYRGLFLWARGHGLSGIWAAGFPLEVDTFLVVGELTLFVALVDQWPVWSRWPAWAVTGCGLAISVAGNIGHVTGHQLSYRLTAAVPPLAAAAALAVGLGALKRIVSGRRAADTPAVTRKPGRKTSPKRTRAPKPASGTEAAVMAAPDTPAMQLAEQLGISDRTVRRYRQLATTNGQHSTT